MPKVEPVGCFAEVGYDVLCGDGEGHVGAIEGVYQNGFGFWQRLVLRLWSRGAAFLDFGDVDIGQSVS